MVLKKDFYFDKPKDENVDEQVEEVKEDEIQMYDFTKQIIIEEATLQDIKAQVVLPQGDTNVLLVPKLVENPPLEFLIKARIQLINKQLFDLIQEIQKNDRKLTNDQVKDKVLQMDAFLNEQIKLGFKIKERSLKQTILEEANECKQKTSTLLEILRTTSVHGRIDNAQLAKLNDLAYRAIQKKGLLKKLDERALKN